MIYKDKIALVTGSAQGLGEAVVKKLAKEGAKGIIIADRNAAKGKQVIADLASYDCKSIFVQVELADPQACRQVFDAIDQHFDGHIHGLVNCAAYTGRGSIEDTSLEEWDKHFAINIKAPFILIQEAVRRMQARKIAGSIVNICSVEAYAGQSFLTPYACTKGALMTLTKNVANSQKFNKIRCNAILPGWMDTPAEHAIQRQYHNASHDWLAKAEAAKPFGKLIKPHEIAELIALLLSDKLGVMTGAIIDFDQTVIGTVGPV
jgi:NAD(P)-dependent dehydrogenase (short-subunit alcohol dehydrogenase family)